MEQGRGKSDRRNGRDGTGHGIGPYREGKGGRGEKGRRGATPPKTSIPCAATADLNPHFVNPGSVPEH